MVKGHELIAALTSEFGGDGHAGFDLVFQDPAGRRFYPESVTTDVEKKQTVVVLARMV